MNDETQNDSFEEFEEDVTEYIGKDEHSKSLALPQQMMPRRMYVLPVSNRPFFPAQVQPIVVNQNPWQETLKRVGETDHKVMGICFVEEPDAEEGVPASEQLETIGCAVRVHHAQNDSGKVQFIAQGFNVSGLSSGCVVSHRIWWKLSTRQNRKKTPTNSKPTRWPLSAPSRSCYVPTHSMARR